MDIVSWQLQWYTLIRIKTNKQREEVSSMRIALIAHDKKKEDMLQFAEQNKHILMNHHLYATKTTGNLIAHNLNLPIKCFLSGPMGGDQQIGSLVATGQIDMVIFLRDPLTAQPHEPDITALLRVCDVHNITVATNVSTAQILLNQLA